MVEFTRTTSCRMEFLRRQLDDPELSTDPAPCGRCDNCAGPRFAASVDDETASAVQSRLTRPGVDLAPRKQWPSGMAKLGVQLSGKITDGAEPGRAIGRLTDLGWGPRLRAVLEGPHSDAPEELVRASIAVLSAWRWAERPAAVLALDSGAHVALAQSLAAQLAQVGRLRNLGVMPLRPDHREVTAQNSAYRVAGLLDAWELPEPIPADGPILLVDALTDTGWTFTMAAHALRRAGASAVLPFAIASTS
jgi:ATP-dependent DNA helicase RecQ